MDSVLMNEVALEELEYSLATRPDAALLSSYEMSVSRQYGPDLPRSVWLTRQFLRCLSTDLRDPAHLNELADYYEREMGQKYNATLCRLSSLATSPAQREVYQAVRDAFYRGTMEPQRCEMTEPISCSVSVILATRNRPVALRHAISSVLAQTFQDFELLVINDGGSDDAETVVRSFHSPKISYFYKKAGGHRSVMNLGWRVSRGKYIAYLDDDDIYYPHHLETAVTAAERGQLDFTCSRNRWVLGKWQDGRWVEMRDLTHQEPFSIGRLHVSAVLQVQNVLHRRSLSVSVGLHLEEPPRGGDWEFWVRCSHYVSLQRLDAVTGEVRHQCSPVSLRLNSVLPVSQPARAAFFTALWRNYYRSAFGNAIVAAAAWHCGDLDMFQRRLDSMQGHWPYLSRRSLELLWEIGLKSHNPAKRFILLEEACYHQPWFLKRMVTGPHPLQKARMAASLPAAGYRALLRYVFGSRGQV